MEALEESIDIEQIHKRHFTAAAMKVQPSPPTPDWLADIYQRFRRGQTKTRARGPVVSRDVQSNEHS